MRASLTTLGGRLHGFSANDAELSFHMFGGPMLATLPGDFSSGDIAEMRLGSLTVDGQLGSCWKGLITGASHEQLEAGGLNTLLSLKKARPWDICLNKTTEYESVEFAPSYQRAKRGHTHIRSHTHVKKKIKLGGWKKRKDDANNNDISVETAPDGILFKWNRETNYWAGSNTSSLVEFAPTNDCTISFSWSFGNISGSAATLKCYVGVPTATHAGGDRWTWTLLWSSSGTSGAQSLRSTVTGATAFLFLGANVVSLAPHTADRGIKVAGITTYGTSVTNPVPGNIITLALDSAGIPSDVRDVDTTGGALIPFEAMGSPLDLVSEVLANTGAQFIWVPRRVGVLTAWFARYALLDDSVAYEIDARDSGADFSGVDIDDAATHCEVSYSSPDGGVLYLTRSTTDGFLARRGAEKWVAVDATQTTDAALAASLGDLALANAAYDRHAGTIPVESVRDTYGVEVPLEHLQCGRRVRVRTLGNTVTPRLTEFRFADGKADLTLDDSPYALDIALADLARR